MSVCACGHGPRAHDWDGGWCCECGCQNFTLAHRKPLAPLPDPDPGFADRLATVRVLWRAPDTMSLYGIPYDMRPGQSPRDLLVNGSTRGEWLWLGSPGWWGSMPREHQRQVEAFLTTHADRVPTRPCEWDMIEIRIS